MKYLIWSNEHSAWWRRSRHGYTSKLAEAGRFPKAEAEQILKEANHYLRSGEPVNETMIPDLDGNIISQALIEALEKVETFDEFKAAIQALNLTEADRVYLATCGIV